MCLVLSWNTGFLANSNAPLLSVYIGNFFCLYCPNLVNNCLIYIASLVAELIAIYSALVVLCVIIDCNFDFYVIGLLVKKNIYPLLVVDLAVAISPAYLHALL
jgi:hypothetical protein